jgi:hypothetical protein
MIRKSRFLSLLLLSTSALVAGTIPDALTPYQMIDISSGHGVASGSVSSGHAIYGFSAIGGQTLDIQLLVTRTLGGGLFGADDSMLWIFDSTGILLDQDDDSGPGYQSRISNFYVPATGLYFAGVTTYYNGPIFTGETLEGWSDDGASNIEFNLDITNTSVPEPSTFALIGLGGIALGFVRRFRK